MGVSPSRNGVLRKETPQQRIQFVITRAIAGEESSEETVVRDLKFVFVQKYFAIFSATNATPVEMIEEGTRGPEDSITPTLRNCVDFPPAVIYLTGLSDCKLGRLDVFDGIMINIAIGVVSRDTGISDPVLDSSMGNSSTGAVNDRINVQSFHPVHHFVPSEESASHDSLGSFSSHDVLKNQSVLTRSQHGNYRKFLCSPRSKEPNFVWVGTQRIVTVVRLDRTFGFRHFSRCYMEGEKLEYIASTLRDGRR
ncbi:hypothetical protein EDD18DRAFT_1426520 [Armillaria luteobubalina]|uniref:Uncharacterized protein n=1 Tax=Armillaria luteobubalina TaxID=153913 RepID=A0AA39QHZ6_9AGAR|nr:hypothetical protein EDD18DRAFT_1426520 [Armillaria luteobubalina]